MFPRDPHRRFHILRTFGNHYAHGFLTVIRTIRRIKRPGSFVESYFAFQRFCKSARQRSGGTGSNCSARIVPTKTTESLALLTEFGNAAFHYEFFIFWLIFARVGENPNPAKKGITQRAENNARNLPSND